MLGSANKLKTARNIALNGAVSGNANFDGSGNVTITTTQANIAVVTGTMTADGTSNALDSGNINFPSGFNNNNCVVISSMLNNNNSQNGSWSIGSGFDSSGYVSGGLPHKTTLNNSGISIHTRNIMMINESVPSIPIFSAGAKFNYKIVLMKIN